ncbi:MAG: ABC transporter ATP-binding protein [Caldilineaceae bacterium]
MINFSHLSKRFGSYTAVDDLSFDVATHEAVALWGPNGAGKTTLIKCLLGLLKYEGRIKVNGYDMHKQGRAARASLGYVPQELAFYDEMSTLDMAEFFARLKQAPLRQVPQVLEQVGLAEHGQKAVGALSGGMKQRLALALALLNDPPVLVLDEPTSNLDTVARSQLLSLLGQVKAAGKTVIFTSHRIEEVETLADRVLVLETGKLQFECSARELAHRMGLRTQIKLRLAVGMLDTALSILRNEGFSVQRNGVGVIVDVPPGEKAKPIHSLSRNDIHVLDFEME